MQSRLGQYAVQSADAARCLGDHRSRWVVIISWWCSCHGTRSFQYLTTCLSLRAFRHVTRRTQQRQPMHYVWLQHEHLDRLLSTEFCPSPKNILQLRRAWCWTCKHLEYRDDLAACYTVLRDLELWHVYQESRFSDAILWQISISQTVWVGDRPPYRLSEIWHPRPVRYRLINAEYPSDLFFVIIET